MRSLAAVASACGRCVPTAQRWRRQPALDPRLRFSLIIHYTVFIRMSLRRSVHSALQCGRYASVFMTLQASVDCVIPLW